MAFAADKINARKKKTYASKEEEKQAKMEKARTMKKNELKQYARKFNKNSGNDQTMIEIATQMSTVNTASVSEQDKTNILRLYTEVLGCKDSSELLNMSAKQLQAPLKPESLLERFAAREANNLKGNKDFL